MEAKNKVLEFMYGETVLHFLMDTQGAVMVNATEMAKIFKRRTKDFLKTENTKAFIEVLNRAPNSARLNEENENIQSPNSGQIIDNRGRNGVYFCRPLALKFAAWLSPEFEVWVFNTLDTIVFGNYKIHWDAHIAQENAKERMASIKEEMLLNPTAEMVAQFFEAERESKSAEATKRKAIKSQYKLF